MPAAAQDAAQEPPNVLQAGAYSFSDELGGFRLLSASGRGNGDDPFVLVQELESASPVTLVIRATKPIRPFDNSGLFASGFLAMRLEVLNNSGLPWVEFGFELQERLGEPSIFSDGLSFDQRKSESRGTSSDRFATFSRNFEPYDRLLFREGHVDAGQTVNFRFLITDFTPRWQFFLVLDPRIPAS
ncbi:MAG: hypothetical protein JNL61_14475 [Rhizobiaceae bacterium]|nr:hypothetical protein [Rhizobiaceae bacterium]